MESLADVCGKALAMVLALAALAACPARAHTYDGAPVVTQQD